MKDDKLISAIDVLFSYLRDAIYAPSTASLSVGDLPEQLKELGTGIKYYVECVMEASEFASALSKGALDSDLPSRGNEIAAPLKSLHASLCHLTWQAQKIAEGDYNQRVSFMGDFASAFNMMVEQLAEREQSIIDKNRKEVEYLEEYAYRDSLTQLYNRAYGMKTLESWVNEMRDFSLIFIDLDGLKHVNDSFGHAEGNIYIVRSCEHLKNFSDDAVICRIGGDEFMVLAPEYSFDKAHKRMIEIVDDLRNDEHQRDKEFSYHMSFGIASVNNTARLSSGEILSIADLRMYDDKKNNKLQAMILRENASH